MPQFGGACHPRHPVSKRERAAVPPAMRIRISKIAGIGTAQTDTAGGEDTGPRGAQLCLCTGNGERGVHHIRVIGKGGLYELIELGVAKGSPPGGEVMLSGGRRHVVNPRLRQLSRGTAEVRAQQARAEQ